MESRVKKLQDLFCLGLGLFTIYTATFGLFTDVIQRSTHLMFAMTILYLNAFTGKEKTSRLVKILSAIFAAASFTILCYTALNYSKIARSYGNINDLQFVFGILIILLILESARRTMGPPIVIIAVIALLYAKFGNYLPGILRHRGYSVKRIVTHLYASSAGIFSTPVGTAATIIIMFIIFGSFLEATKGSKFFMDISFALTGRSVGGPAKAAVVSSCMMGMISGSASANVVATGIFTIPLMKKTGYKDYFAGAVEAVASTGSQIMPPVMGAAAFIIAETLGISYGKVAIAAFIPALLYYVACFIMVHLEAGKTGLKKMDESALPDWKKTVIEYGHCILPLFILIILISMGYSPMYTALFAILGAIIISFARKYTRIDFKEGIDAIIKGSKQIISISSACATAGIITGVISLTGLGLKMSQIIIQLSGGQLLIALVLTLISVLILGMGMPTAPAYMLVAVLVVPAITSMGVPDLAAHLFVFYGACLSSITPPVAMAAYTAASIAQASPLKIGYTAVRLGAVAIIMPFFFAYQPALIAQGTLTDILLALVSGLVGCFGLSVCSEGYFKTKVDWYARIIIGIGGLLCIKPGIYTDLIGYVLIAGITVLQYTKANKSATLAA